MKQKVIAIVGPTSSGKTALGVWLAKQIKKDFRGAEIISADSRQVYGGLNIGTGKVTKKETGDIPHHLLDVASPNEQFSADDFVRLASSEISNIKSRGHIPIIVGGTGFYTDTLLGRMIIPQVPPNPSLRARLEKKTAVQLFTMLKKKDSRRAATIEPQHKRRLIRAIEIAEVLGKNPVPSQRKPYDVLWLGLNPGEKKLKKNIRIRLLARIRSGMISEAKKLHRAGLSYKRMEALGLEYRSLARMLQKKISREEFEIELERAINDYAKRQLRWFRRNPDIVWIKNPPAGRAGKTEAARLAKKFLSGR